MMPNFNIHWKGYPHHRLPRLRVVSTRRNSVHSRNLSISRQSSTTTSRTPNHKENKKVPFIQFRRRRVRASRAASSVARARRRASVRARQNIQVLGWDTSEAEPASKVTTERTESGHLTPNRVLRSESTLRLDSLEDSGIPSTDGAASSAARRIKGFKKKSDAYSLRYLAQEPVYWTADHPSTGNKPFLNPDRLYSAQHSRPLQATSNRISTRLSPTVERTLTYDTRVDPKVPVATKRYLAPIRPHFKPNTFRKATSQVSPGRRNTSIGSPEFWEAVKNYSRQSHAQGTSTASAKSIVQTLLSDSASRTSSQKKVLARFTKGIELYLQAAKSLPKQSLDSSPSSTTISAYTIQELKPYQSEFQSVGLAVTSAEQRGMAKLQKGLTPPPTPPKDNHFDKSRSSPAKTNYVTQSSQAYAKAATKGKDPSYASGSTGTTVLGWTPPHEKTYGRPKAEPKAPSVASSNHTIIGFTPPHEIQPRRPSVRPPPSSPQPFTKKSLPWLRGPDSSPEKSPTKKMSVISTDAEHHRPSTPLEGWVSTFDVVESPEKRKKSKPEENPQTSIGRRSTEKKWEDMRYSTRPSTASNYMSRVVTEITTQTGPILDRTTEPMPYKPVYVNIATQTDFKPVVSSQVIVKPNQLEDQPKTDRASIPSSCSKTFPLKSSKCRGYCIQPAFEPLLSEYPERSPRPSMVTREGVDEGTQTVDLQPVPQEKTETRSSSTMKPSLQSDAKLGERTCTIPFATTPTRRVGPYQAPPVSMSPNKSVDEGISRQNQIIQESGEPKSSSESKAFSPVRRIPSPPPLCTQCAGHLKLRSPELGHQPAVASYPEPEVQMHACTARSSIQCQQCFPSSHASIAVSPLEADSPVELKPVRVQYLPDRRRSTRPIIPTGPYGYPEESPNHVAVEQALTDSPKSYHSPERKGTQSKVEETMREFERLEPVADPMKRPSLSRLKLKHSRPEPTLKHVQGYSNVSRAKTLPPMPKVPAVEVPPLPASATVSSLDSCPPKAGDITDKQVFKGLHVATAAACDEDVDKWIEEITGSSARKFLSALSAFDGLGANTLVDVARRAAKQRREKVRAWEAIREKRVTDKEGRPRCEIEKCSGEEYAVGNQEVSKGSGYAQESISREDIGEDYVVHDQGVTKGREELTRSMLNKRECKESEGVRGRALKMGWRERSVSEGV